uniref:UBC core domain-containing protein n=1 Tax=Takifugu rubripes TaxID=31033 RepID=A0A674N0G5_TAKRU
MPSISQWPLCKPVLTINQKPVLTIKSIIYDLLQLFMRANPNDPLNQAAADALQINQRLFQQNIQGCLESNWERWT